MRFLSPAAPATAALLLALASALPAVAGGADVRIPAHGAPLPTDAVDLAAFPKLDARRAASKLVRLPALSTRVEPLRIADAGTLVCPDEGIPRASIRGGPGARVGIEVVADGVTVRDVSVEGFADCGISIGAAGRTIRDVVLAGVEVAMPAGNDGIAIYPAAPAGGFAVDGLLLERVRVSGADQGFTVATGPVRSVALREVVIRNRKSDGGSGADAIGIESGENFLLDGVEAAGSAGDGIDLKVRRAAVISAWVHDCARNGIKLWHGGDVVNSLVHDCGADASIVFDGAGRYRVVATTVAFHNRAAKGEKAYVLACGYDRPSDLVELELAGALFWKNTGGLGLSPGTRRTVRASFLGPRAFEGGGLPVMGDARFLGAEPRDPLGFRPARGSPLHGAAAGLAGYPKRDLLGQPRSPRAPSVGALEPGK